MGKSIKNNTFGIPPPAQLPNTETILPHVILGDAAFPLMKNLMKPYPRSQSLVEDEKAIFNYRHSRARRVVENAFGILAQTFRIFRVPITLLVDAIDDLIMSACILHNLLIECRAIIPDQIDNDEIMPLPEDNFLPIQNLFNVNDEHSGNDEQIDIQSSIEIRNKFKEYFNSVGSVEWQNDLLE